ncbi:MAG: biotin-dependent carboxyltransferase family protein [Ilumatobacteraceae bacterium]
MIEVLVAGMATTVQDRGRPGWAHLGVGRSGAADVGAHALANRLVGNAEGLAALETSGGLVLRCVAPALVAVTGAPAPLTIVGGPALGYGHAHVLPAGATLTVGVPRAGLRTYVAVRGGIDVAPVLGSRSRDTLGQIGPSVRAGDVLPIGADPGTPITGDVAPARPAGDVVGVLPGWRRDWFAAGAWALLCGQPYTVGNDVDRVGCRLAGARPLERVVTDELPSEGLVLGAVQVPPDGQPIVMLADHPTTGGYPVIAVVDDASLGVVAQARPGDTLHLRPGR